MKAESKNKALSPTTKRAEEEEPERQSAVAKILTKIRVIKTKES